MIVGTTAYVLAVVSLATIVRSTLGFGEALVAVPLLALRIPVAVATPFVVAVSVIVALANIALDHEHIELGAAKRLVLWALVGLPVGIVILRVVDDRVVKALLGSLIVAVSLYAIMRRKDASPRAGHPGWLVLAGVTSGVLGGAYGMNGPPLAIYGTLRGWSARQFRATLQAYFLAASFAGLIGYALAGMWSAAATRYLILSLPCVVAAIVLARALNRRLSGASFFRVVYGGIMAIGILLIIQAAVV